jgi:hypothetical protein
MQQPTGLNRYEWWWCRFLYRHPALRNTWATEGVMAVLAGIALYAFFRMPAGQDAGWAGLGAGLLAGAVVGRCWPVVSDKVIAGLTAELLSTPEPPSSSDQA